MCFPIRYSTRYTRTISCSYAELPTPCMGTNLGDKIFSICSSGLFIRCGSLQFILELESTFSVTHTRDFTLKYYCHEVCEGDF